MRYDVVWVDRDLGLILEAKRGAAEGASARIKAFSNGAEAMEFLAQREQGFGEKPDLILLDRDLPGEQRSALVDEMRAVPGVADVPLVLYSRDEGKGRSRLSVEHATGSPELKNVANRLLEFVGTAPLEPRLPTPARGRSGGRSQDEAEPHLANLIRSVREDARRACRSLPATIRPDAESAAMVGLVEAMRRFGQLEGEHFDNYLQLRVRGAIRDEARRFDPLPRRTRHLIRRMEQVVEAYRKDHGTDPEMEVVAETLGVDEDRCWQAAELAEFDTLPIDDDTLAGTTRSTDDQFVESYAAAALRWALARLSKRSRLVLRLWYRRGFTVAAISARLQVSLSRVHQLRIQAERQLEKYLKNAPPMSDLADTAKRFDWDDHTDEARTVQSLEKQRGRVPTPIRYGNRPHVTQSPSSEGNGLTVFEHTVVGSNRGR